jgi:predicted GIY-YIG superfamily endonuclease
MPKYYTETGQVIRKPSSYAATGAPMYSTKYSNTKNINQSHDIYKVNCSNGKTYIGKTTNIERRANEHFTGNGSKVTQKFKPRSIKVIDTCPGYFSSEQEQYHTKKYMDKYGFENVRGGYYTNSHTLCENEFVASSQFNGSKNGFIFKRGNKGLGYYRDK